MKCPFCSNDDTKVVDTRSMEDNTSIRRRRLCEKCNEKFTTYEKIDTIPISVVKRDFTREKFDRDKILSGIMLACNKRPISINDMENIVKDIENKIFAIPKKEIDTAYIGELVMEKLRGIDCISYVRFASVYREFKDLDSFTKEIEKLLENIKNSKNEIL